MTCSTRPTDLADMNVDVQMQHTQVSAAGDMEPLHVGLLLDALGRMVHTPPEAFVERDTLLHRSDDETARPVETSDTQWSNVRRAREHVRLSLRTEHGLTQLVLPQPPAPPGATPSVAVRTVVMVEMLTPVPEPPTAPALEPTSIFAISMEELARHAHHRAGWDELVRLLQWTPDRQVMRYGLRFVLPSDNARVLHELRVFRALDVRICYALTQWTHDASNRPMEWTPSSVLHVRAVSTLRSDVGPRISKAEQDETARALQYAIQHTQRLQQSLDAIVPLTRDAP